MRGMVMKNNLLKSLDHREHRENTIIIKQKTGNRVINKKMR
jgi:hypothetical protein